MISARSSDRSSGSKCVRITWHLWMCSSLISCHANVYHPCTVSSSWFLITVYRCGSLTTVIHMKSLPTLSWCVCPVSWIKFIVTGICLTLCITFFTNNWSWFGCYISRISIFDISDKIISIFIRKQYHIMIQSESTFSRDLLWLWKGVLSFLVYYMHPGIQSTKTWYIVNTCR